ncbi:hypothetical protein [Salinarimonas ramus]|uniref:hypothetical protein n=1 Tax=Salinarimonas ramus TaxID=690164 RepID=UPI001667E08D|nr:hypothetical protein [Salinarimonas ramus]
MLRQETKTAHAAAERVFVRAVKEAAKELGEDAATAGPTLLVALNGSLVAWLGTAVPRLVPGLFATEIALFVAAAGAAHSRSTTSPRLPAPRLDDEAEIVGAAYAVCGSALGGAALATLWRDATAPGWAGFCAVSRTLEERWPAFRDALDRWGEAADDAARAAALEGALRAFDHAGALVSLLSPILHPMLSPEPAAEPAAAMRSVHVPLTTEA